MAVAMTESSRCWHLGPTWQLAHSPQDLLISILMSMSITPVKLLVPKMISTTSVQPSTRPICRDPSSHTWQRSKSEHTHALTKRKGKNHPWQILRFDIETHICYWIAFIGNFVWWRCGNICRDHIFRILSEGDLQDGSHSKVLLTVAWV